LNHVEVCWIVTPCSVVVGYQRSRGPCWLCVHLTLHGVTTQKTSTWNITAMKVSKLASEILN